MNSSSLTNILHYDIINNILNTAATTLVEACLDKVKSYEASLSSSANKTELIRFSRHISLEAYFENIQDINNKITNAENDVNKIQHTTDNNTKNTTDNTSALLVELSTIESNNTESDDTVLILQLSSAMDNLLKELSTSDKKIYLYRYFFAYSIEAIADITGTQSHSIEKTLASCNNKLKTLLKENKLICDSKLLLLSLTDIDDSYLLPLIKLDSKSKNNQTTTDDENLFSLKEKHRLSLPKCLNFIFAATIVILALLNIVQYTDNKAAVNPEETSSSDIAINKNEYVSHSVHVNSNQEKVVDFEKLMEDATFSDGYEQPFTYTNAYFSGKYDPLSLPEEFSLKDYIGTEISELAEEYKSYYRFIGSDNMQYIIREFNDDYTLYWLSYVSISDVDLLTDPGFTANYGEILSTFYGATNSNDIKEISIWHASDTGYADSMTKKVILYENDIDYVFNQIKKSSYNGMLLSDYCTQNGISGEFVMDNSVQLIFHLKDGSTNDKLLYYPNENWFYDTITEMIFVPDIEPNAVTYLKEMLRFNEQKKEPSDPESWIISSAFFNIEPEYLTILIQNDSISNANGLYVSSEYTVHKLENDVWVDAPSSDVTVSYPIITYQYKIGSSVMISFPIQEKYAALEPGKYRLTLTISDSHSEDLSHPNSKEFYVDFTID